MSWRTKPLVLLLVTWCHNIVQPKFSLHTIYIQDGHSLGVPFLRATIKLHMYHCAWNKACLWQQAHLAQGSFSSVHGIQVHQTICPIPPFACVAAYEVQLLRHHRCVPCNPSGVVLLNINKHGLKLWMGLQHYFKQGMQFQQNLHSATLTQPLELQQDIALQFLQWLTRVSPACHSHPGVWLFQLALQ